MEWSTQMVILGVGVGVMGAVVGYLLAWGLGGKTRAALLSLEQQYQTLQDAFSVQKETLQAEQNALRQHQARYEQLGQEKHAVERELSSSQAQLQSTSRQLEEQRQVTLQRESMIERLQEQLSQLKIEHERLETTLEKREESYQEQIAQLKEARESLTKDFENIANKIFEEKGKTFTSTSKDSIDVLLKPFREQIEGFQKRINEVHTDSVRSTSTLSAEIKKVMDIGLTMSQEATNLTSALKGDSQQRGAWGEAQLERTLEMSGLVEDAHYEKQTQFADADGKRRITDYLVKLPDGKHIIIDSKVSLVAYDRAVSADSPEAYNLAMVEHVKAVRAHIDDLSKKDYTNLVGMRSPSFVLMFMPIEPAYIEALKNNKDLFEYGYKKNVVLVSHTTLIPILRTVSNLWMMERSNSEAREISERAGEIFNQVCIVAERLQKLGNTLGTANRQYNDTVKGLVGQQGLYGKVERFDKLSSKVSKSLPDLQPNHADIDVDRLSLIVEPIEEPVEAGNTALSDQASTEASKERESGPTASDSSSNAKIED